MCWGLPQDQGGEAGRPEQEWEIGEGPREIFLTARNRVLKAD